ncbi:Histone H4 acetyltransferase, NuA4 complex, Eaf6 family protein [Pseudohyphozyma bogoriensis]|nr:Histone H4 acetyltransferase, NuA4 complex, Eaf6 family protein [Pseudohyphozyma bogoriensis]
MASSPAPEASTSAAAAPPPTTDSSAADTPAAPAAGEGASSTPNPLEQLTAADLRKKLDNSRRELRGYLEKKRRLDKELATLEASIHAFEGSYLSDALLPASTSAGNTNAQFGNIIKGYDSYLKAATTGGDRKRGRATEEARDADRMFSRSSATFQKALDLKNPEAVESASEEESASANGRQKRRRDR